MYEDAKSALAAVRWFNGKDVDGRIISVSIAQDMKGPEAGAGIAESAQKSKFELLQSAVSPHFGTG